MAIGDPTLINYADQAQKIINKLYVDLYGSSPFGNMDAGQFRGIMSGSTAEKIGNEALRKQQAIKGSMFPTIWSSILSEAERVSKLPGPGYPSTGGSVDTSNLYNTAYGANVSGFGQSMIQKQLGTTQNDLKSQLFQMMLSNGIEAAQAAQYITMMFGGEQQGNAGPPEISGGLDLSGLNQGVLASPSTAGTSISSSQKQKKSPAMYKFLGLY